MEYNDLTTDIFVIFLFKGCLTVLALENQEERDFNKIELIHLITIGL